MTGLVLLVVGLLVGVPLLAWWIGGRPFWARLRGRPERDPWGDLVRRHRLTPGEAARIGAAVPRGVRFDDARLRAAAVEWAHELLDTAGNQWPRSARGRRLLVGAAVLWAAAVVGWAVSRVVSGHAGDVNWVMAAVWTAAGIWLVRRRRGLRRTLALNEPDPADARDA
ncbi:hypothetical protein [Blastococcus sp. SYSU D00820]